MDRCSRVERGFYLREMARAVLLPSSSSRSCFCPAHLRIPLLRQCYEFAAELNPLDSEAHFWTGFYWMQQGDQDLERKTSSWWDSWQAIRLGINHLETSARLCATDARTYAYLGSAYTKQWQFFCNHILETGDHDNNTIQTVNMKHDKSAIHLVEEEELEKTIRVLQRAVWLEDACTRALGCSISSSGSSSSSTTEDADIIATALLSLGEMFMYQGQYSTALDYLMRVDAKAQACPTKIRNALIRTALSLQEECLERLS
jgi:tetratricopeptide (TPR) repeat protein